MPEYYWLVWLVTCLSSFGKSDNGSQCINVAHAMVRVGQNRIYTLYTVYDRTFGGFPAQNTVNTPCIYGSGQGCVIRRIRII
jgi:hypothetical protein